MNPGSRQRGGGRQGRRGRAEEAGPPRAVDYHNLANPFTPQAVFTEDEVESLHRNALRILQELGIRILLPEARDRLKAVGALVDDDSWTVRIGSDIVEQALASAPASFTLKGAHPGKDLLMAPGRLSFKAGAGCPNVYDRMRGRRPGDLASFIELMKLTQCFDVLQMQGASLEPQDVPVHLRHYQTVRVQLTVGDKAPWIFCRGRGQVADAFEMIRILHGLSEEEFLSAPRSTTVVNTNSPRQIDNPMAQGIIDFALNNQICMITPFCLLGAMAPITVAGALSLQHAEALAGITLSQIANPGAPVLYGNFASNVDMKSGAPTFGTPEHIKATLGSGQLARRVGLPWRSSAGSGANVADAQGAHETELSGWAAVLAGATAVMHSAGWLEGGLTFGYEKMITDLEMVQTFAELCTRTPVDDAEMAFEAIADVAPGGHFFATGHTMERYRSAFYDPLVADHSNYGQWLEKGSQTADQRATAIWQGLLDTFEAPKRDEARLEALDAFIERRAAEGGAPPLS